MTQEELFQELLAFFKVLAEENRLKMIGLLANQPYSVEALAEALGISVSTTSHHLSRLTKAGLVSARTDGHYYYYSLNSEALETKARHLLRKEDLPALSPTQPSDNFEKKVLTAFIDADGRINAIPVQEKKFIVLLKHVLKEFTPGVNYSEKEVNTILQKYNEDTAAFRRGLIEYHLMQRTSDGKQYWRTDQPKN
jgi:predicted transcriptional regulator